MGEKSFAFQCACGERHVGPPNHGFTMPIALAIQPEKVQAAAVRSRDFCAFEGTDGQRYYFARVLLPVPIQGSDDPFMWGIWVQLEAPDYRQYLDAYEQTEPQFRFKAWIRNDLPFYPQTDGLPIQLVSRAGGKLPTVEMQPLPHRLSIDMQEGMTQEMAAKMAASFCLAGKRASAAQAAANLGTAAQ